MTLYEVIITRGGASDSMVVSGQHSVQAASSFLTAAAQAGELGRVERVEVYDEVVVSSDLLSRLLQHLHQPHDWVESDKEYPVYLSEA